METGAGGLLFDFFRGIIATWDEQAKNGAAGANIISTQFSQI
jgi:hypothetical protein